MEAAVAAVLAKQFSLALAAMIFKIPPSTLRDHVSSENKQEQSHSVGRPTQLSAADELSLLRWIQLRARLRFPASKSQILKSAAAIAKQRGTPFSTPTGKPSKKWFSRFKKQYRDEYNMVKPSKIKSGQAGLTRETINEAYDLFEQCCEEYGIAPDDLWNFDETGFDKVTGGRKKRAKDAKMQRAEFLATFSEHVTLGAAASATGVRTPPFFLFKGNPQSEHAKDAAAEMLKGTESTGAAYAWTGNILCIFTFVLICTGCSENAWITKDTFFAFIIFFAEICVLAWMENGCC